MATPRNVVAFIIIHPQKSKRVTAKIILVSPLRYLWVNDYKGNSISGRDHYMFGPHHLHCLDLTDTYLYNYTKGKTYRVNQRWRHTTWLQHPCYDVGCYSWLWEALLALINAILKDEIWKFQSATQYNKAPAIYNKQWRPRWNAVYCSMSSGASLFVNVKMILRQKTLFFESLDIDNGLSQVYCIKPEGGIHYYTKG